MGKNRVTHFGGNYRIRTPERKYSGKKCSRLIASTQDRVLVTISDTMCSIYFSEWVVIGQTFVTMLGLCIENLDRRPSSTCSMYKEEPIWFVQY